VQKPERALWVSAASTKNSQQKAEGTEPRFLGRAINQFPAI
jgi:hypothetical protein